MLLDSPSIGQAPLGEGLGGWEHPRRASGAGVDLGGTMDEDGALFAPNEVPDEGVMEAVLDTFGLGSDQGWGERAGRWAFWAIALALVSAPIAGLGLYLGSQLVGSAFTGYTGFLLSAVDALGIDSLAKLLV